MELDDVKRGYYLLSTLQTWTSFYIWHLGLGWGRESCQKKISWRGGKKAQLAQMNTNKVVKFKLFYLI